MVKCHQWEKVSENYIDKLGQTRKTKRWAQTQKNYQLVVLLKTCKSSCCMHLVQPKDNLLQNLYHMNLTQYNYVMFRLKSLDLTFKCGSTAVSDTTFIQYVHSFYKQGMFLVAVIGV